uniref:Uncharacterized protein n=1 Tax=Auxenochlorella protothecoides TaxID=3075 RepID=A0A1D1ZRD5_AUXPR
MLVRRLVPLPAAGCTLAAPSPRFRHAATFARRHGSSSGLLEELDREVDRALERATRATVTWTPLATGFVSPAVTAAVVSALSTSADTGVIPWGGYPQAERARLLLGPRDMLDVWAGEPAGAPWPPPPPPIQILHVRGNFLFDPGRHADFLGAVLGTGIERSMGGVQRGGLPAPGLHPVGGPTPQPLQGSRPRAPGLRAGELAPRGQAQRGAERGGHHLLLWQGAAGAARRAAHRQGPLARDHDADRVRGGNGARRRAGLSASWGGAWGSRAPVVGMSHSAGRVPLN